jgi:hypothetical protein
MRSLAFVALVSLTCFSQQLQPAAEHRRTEGAVSILVRDLPSHKISLLAPGDPTFDGAADEILANKPALLALKHISVVLANNSDKHIVGYAVTWHFADPNGRIINKQATFMQPASLSDGNRRNLFPNHPGSTLIESGTKRLISPLAAIGTSTNLARMETPAFQNALSGFDSLMNESSEVSITLDGILFEDGSFVGPNRTGFYDSIVKTFDTVQNFNRELLKLSQSGSSDQDLMDWAKHQKENIGSISDVSSAELLAAANEFLSISQQSGIPMALAVVRGKTFSNRPSFSKLPE